MGTPHNVCKRTEYRRDNSFGGQILWRHEGVPHFENCGKPKNGEWVAARVTRATDNSFRLVTTRTSIEAPRQQAHFTNIFEVKSCCNRFSLCLFGSNYRGVKQAPSRQMSQGQHSPPIFLPWCLSLCRRLVPSTTMSYDRRLEDSPPTTEVLSSALNALQGRFTTSSTPIGGTTTGRGESFFRCCLGGVMWFGGGGGCWGRAPGGAAPGVPPA